MTKCALYRVVHLESGKDYVGISVNPSRRWSEHRALANQCKTFFHKALAKYGPEAFSWTVIAWASCYSGAAALEQIARRLGLGHYNLTLGGEGCRGLVRESLPKWHATKLVEAARIANKGRKFSDSHRANLSKVRRQRPLPSAETKAKTTQSLLKFYANKRNK